VAPWLSDSAEFVSMGEAPKDSWRGVSGGAQPAATAAEKFAATTGSDCVPEEAPMADLVEEEPLTSEAPVTLARCALRHLSSVAMNCFMAEWFGLVRTNDDILNGKGTME